MATTDGLTRRALLASGVLVATTIGANTIVGAAPRELAHFDLAGVVPERFGRWRALDVSGALVPDADEQRNVTQAYEEALTRSYVSDDGKLVMLVVAHGRPGSGLLAIHDARVCYTAQGFAVRATGTSHLAAPFDFVSGKRLFAVRDERREPIVYWASAAGEQTNVGVAQKLRLLRAAWDGRALDAFLVRASVFGDNDATSFALIDGFLRDLLTAIPPALRGLLVGTAAS